MKAIDKAYLAGLIDGEGCIFVNHNKQYTHAGIAINMTDKICPLWAKQISGVGTVRRKKSTNRRHRDSWRWTAWSNEAASLLKILLPFLRLKKRHARNLILFQKTHDQKYYKKARSLNRRGRWI